ncbi:MAG: serine/threonine-protein kinase [Acidobacteriota bacterium]
MSDQRHDPATTPPPRGDDAGADSGPGRSQPTSRATLQPERWRRIAGVVEVALELDPATRSAYLEMLGRANEDLRWQVLAVLRAVGVVSSGDPLSEPTLPAAPLMKDRIGPWRVLELLGRGGMGAVFLAERDDEAYERRVAIKVISAGFEAPMVYRRFLAERQILAGFDHPYIARLLDGGAAHDGRPYLVMEYVDGVPFDRFCFERRVDLRARLFLFLKVCSAVAYAHRKLVVHRDLKPSNILVTADGEPKLLDFGIAKLLDPAGLPVELEATQTANAVLTPKWASPEQLRGEAISTGTDVYALGLLLFKILTGHLPHPEKQGLVETLESRNQVARPSREIEESGDTVLEAWPGASPRSVAQRLRGDLDNIVRKALRFEAAHRYPSVSALADDLRRFLDGRPVSATRDSLTYQSGKFIGRYRWQVLAAAVLFVSIVTTASVALYQANAVRREQAVTQLALESAEAQASRAEASQSFLASLLRAADETERRRQGLSLEDLLSEGLERIEEGAVADPAARLDLLSMLSISFLEFRDIDSSLRTLELATEAARESGADPLERANLLARLGTHLVFNNRFEEGAAACEEALEVAPPEAREVRLGCLATVRYSLEVLGRLSASATVTRQMMEIVGDMDEAELYGFMRRETNVLDDSIAKGHVEVAYYWTRSLAQIWASGGFGDLAIPPGSLDLMIALVEKQAYAEASALAVHRFGGDRFFHEHDIFTANAMLTWIDALLGLGELAEAGVRLDAVESMTAARLEDAAADPRARYLEGAIHYRRALLAGLLGDVDGRRRECAAALAISESLREELGFFLPVERLHLETLLEDGRLEEAGPLLSSLLDLGYRRPSTLRKARAAGLSPEPVEPLPDLAVELPANVEAIFQRLRPMPMPWERADP